VALLRQHERPGPFIHVLSLRRQVQARGVAAGMWIPDGEAKGRDAGGFVARWARARPEESRCRLILTYTDPRLAHHIYGRVRVAPFCVRIVPDGAYSFHTYKTQGPALWTG